ncbi:MAG: alcohol dehydrogenase [Candidatus Solibacter sp.]|nr:alcohol dehydrogenase [Candidatus Solibacter sp.]
MRKLYLAIAFSVVCGTMWSQAVSTSQVSGTVQDSSGAAVPIAQVTLRQIETGQVRAVVTGNDGTYLIPNLPIGPYRLEVAREGFATPPAMLAGDFSVIASTQCQTKQICFFCTVAQEPTLCRHTRRYMYERIDRFPYLLGGFSECGYVMPEAGRIRVPDDVPNELASLASCALRSVMNAVDVLGGIGSTEVIVIQGSGPLGLLATAVAKVAGARRVITSAFAADESLSIERTSPEKRSELQSSLDPAKQKMFRVFQRRQIIADNAPLQDLADTLT